VLTENNVALDNVEANGQCRKLLEEIQAAIKAGDVSAIRHTAEALKGPITSVFANEAFAAASELENTLHEGDLTRARNACRRLRMLVNCLAPMDEADR
jgi:hypothetical protein